MGALVPLCSGTVNTVTLVNTLSVDHGVVVGLGMRPATEGTALGLGPALRGVMTPSHASRAYDRAGMRLSALDATVRAGNRHELADELAGLEARGGIMNVDPCDA